MILATRLWIPKLKIKRKLWCYLCMQIKTGGLTVKEILLIGDSIKGDTFINDLINQGSFKIRKANSPLKALKLLKENSPDYLMCTGKIKETIDGKYFVELET